MGYMIAIAPCACCERVFDFNPDHVPSVRDARGNRQPVCRDCVERANPIREANGKEPFKIHPLAYEPQEVE